MATNGFGIKKFLKFFTFTPTIGTEGEVRWNGTSHKIEAHDGTATRAVVTESGTDTLTNKTLNGSLNTLSNITATTNANLTGPITSVGNATSVASQTGTGSTFVMNTSPTLVTPALGTPTALVGTNITGTASGLTAGTVTTNANLTGPITSSGNTTSVASQTGTGSTFVMNTSPTLVTPNLGTPTTLVGTNITGTASGLTAGTVTTNANLTGDVTSSGNATTLATVNSNVGTFASVTVNGKGLATAAANLSGDATTSSSTLTLATVNSNVGSFGSSTSIPSLTVNGKGLVTAASGNVVIAPAGTLSGTTLNSSVVSSSLTSVGTITSGTWTGTTIALANGGTGQTTKAAAFDALQPMTTGGDIIYGGASGTGTRLANGSSGQFLKSNGGTAAPSWAAATAAPAYNYTSQTSNYTAVVGDFIYVPSGTFTVTLPTAASIAGQSIIVKNDGSGTVTINTTSSQTIDDMSSGTLKLATRNDKITVISNGTNWELANFGVAVKMLVNATSALSGTITSTASIAIYDTQESDPWSMYNTGTGVATIKTAGMYMVKASINVGNTLIVGDRMEIGIRKNSTLVASNLWRSQVVTTNQNYIVQCVTILSCSSSDTVDVTFLSTGGSPVYSVDANRNRFEITRIN